jgi:putative peptidoglycan lipid II flippase
MLLVCLAAVYISMANARGHFFVPALGAVLLNVIMISSVLFLAPHLGVRLDQRVFALAIGVVVAGFAQAFFQFPSLRHEGYRFHWIPPRHDPTVRQVVVKMLPGSIGVAAFQINVLITQCFSYWFDPTIVSNFNYAVRLMELPQGMFGISLATYLLPTLSGLAAEKKYPEFRESLGEGLSYLSFANLLAAAIAFALAEPIVRLLFERGAFDPSGTMRVGLALACLAPGLLMFSMNNILARAFYALNDIKTPMKISLLCLCLNIGFALILVLNGRREAGLATANTITASINLALLVYALRRKLSRLGLSRLRKTLIVLLPNALLAAVIAKTCAVLWERQVGHAHIAEKIGAVFVPAAIAGMAYWLVALATKEPAAHDILKLIRRRIL